MVGLDTRPVIVRDYSDEDADILVVDEILAVGDFKFQEKCKAKMRELLEGGTTLLFVSHNGDQVKELCSRAIWLNHGVVMEDGPADVVYDKYAAMMEQS